MPVSIWDGSAILSACLAGNFHFGITLEMLYLMHKLTLGGVREGKVYFSFLKSVKKVSQSLILSLIANCGLLGSYAPFPTVYITFW